MTKAQKKLVERLVVGPKPIYGCTDPKTGKHVVGQVGDIVLLPIHSAKTFARYLKSPEVAAAEAAVVRAEADAEEDPGVTGARAEVAKTLTAAAAELDPTASVNIDVDASAEGEGEGEEEEEEDGSGEP